MTKKKEKYWYVIYTKPRWEKKVHGLLSDQGIEAYCPLNRVKKKWSDRMKWVDEPLFKSYVFVRILPDDQTLVRMVPGVINYIYWLGKPAVVKDNEIEDIRRFLNEHTDVKVESIELRPDDRVIIRTGLLMDREATVQRIMHKTVEVLIESLGYKLVAQVDKDKIVPVAKNQT
jgi:transcription antitermination factor NusG